MMSIITRRIIALPADTPNNGPISIMVMHLQGEWNGGIPWISPPGGEKIKGSPGAFAGPE
jgi:hypothetical protein